MMTQYLLRCDALLCLCIVIDGILRSWECCMHLSPSFGLMWISSSNDAPGLQRRGTEHLDLSILNA